MEHRKEDEIYFVFNKIILIIYMWNKKFLNFFISEIINGERRF